MQNKIEWKSNSLLFRLPLHLVFYDHVISGINNISHCLFQIWLFILFQALSDNSPVLTDRHSKAKSSLVKHVLRTRRYKVTSMCISLYLFLRWF